MATNTNTNNTVLSTDIYDISAFIDQIRADNITDIDGTSSMVGIFGYMNEIFSQSLQNALIAAAETSNEAIATRAKFTKNVIAHAMNLGITDIFAFPASMTMMFYLPVSYIEQNFVEYDEASGRGKFILDKNIPINVEDYQFHFDYDIIINRTKNAQGNYVYTAMYDLFESGTAIIKQVNPISDITNPYITTVIQTSLNDTNYIAFSAKVHQVSILEIEQTILTDNPIENKSITFSFDGQLACFDVDIVENETITHLTPIYQGLLDNSIESNWCYYEFLDENTIRVLFDRDSYLPGLNAQIKVNIKICDGSSGNFTYTESFRSPLLSSKYNDYNGMHMVVYPLMGGVSSGGKDKKTIKDLKKIIPREASSRGAIINTTDLQNFFNSIDNDNCKIYFKKKRDNQFERTYYAYILMKKDDYVYPTNTLPLRVLQTDFKGFSENNNLVLKPGTRFYYYNHGSDTANNYATLTPPEYENGLDEYSYNVTKNIDDNIVRVFEYTTPFLISIDDDFITSYLMTVMNENKTFKFVSINTNSDLQFIATNMNWSRKFIYEDENGDRQIYDNKYTMTVNVLQNNAEDYGLVKYHTDESTGNIIFDDIRVKMIMVLYADDTETNPYKYAEAELTDFNDAQKMYTFKFTVTTDDTMDLNNRINISGVYNAKPEAFQLKDSLNNSHGYMNKNTYAKIFIMADFGTKAGDITSDGIEITEDTEEIILYPNNGDGNDGNRVEIENLIPNKMDMVNAFLNDDIYIKKDDKVLNITSIMRSHNEYMQYVYSYNGDEQQTDSAIMRYIRNNKNSNFVQNILLNDEDTLEVINSYNFVDLSRYTVCNVLSVDGGIEFYHDYSSLMKSSVNAKQIQKTDELGNQLYQQVQRTDEFGNSYTEYKPIYLIGDNNTYIYNYTIDRVPMIRDNYLMTEEAFQDYVYDLEERRKYMEECLYTLEDTFNIDLKFFNTYGPSQTFYYNIPSSQDYKAKVAIKEINVLANMSDEDNVVDTLEFNTQVHVIKTRGQWALINSPVNGWIKTGDIIKNVDYIDNVALSFEWALEAQSSADKYITQNIIRDIKEYIEDINEITEVHIPNIITLITNNYREQLIYFEFLDVNGYGSACQHLYHIDNISADICPEFLNVATKNDGATSEINIAVY